MQVLLWSWCSLTHSGGRCWSQFCSWESSGLRAWTSASVPRVVAMCHRYMVRIHSSPGIVGLTGNRLWDHRLQPSQCNWVPAVPKQDYACSFKLENISRIMNRLSVLQLSDKPLPRASSLTTRNVSSPVSPDVYVCLCPPQTLLKQMQCLSSATKNAVGCLETHRCSTLES